MNETLYITSATSLLDRIARIDSIILALELQIVNVGAGNSDVQSYSLDDGQTKIQTQYTSIESITKAIQGFDALRERLLNQLNGRSMILRDVRGLQ
jgi:hypothetical protein